MKTPFKNRSKINTFSDRQNLRESVSNRTVIQKNVKRSFSGRKEMVSHGILHLQKEMKNNGDVALVDICNTR